MIDERPGLWPALGLLAVAAIVCAIVIVWLVGGWL